MSTTPSESEIYEFNIGQGRPNTLTAGTNAEARAFFGAAKAVNLMHVVGLQTAEAREQLGMSTPAFATVTAGTLIRATQIQELRDRAR
ncbi:MAG TPA: hypothetical protein VEK79_01845 [Thermoanaerobaculia bacterium]|nr:hypothetical protein [Thermoanaerobaculia bacterium]